MMKHQLCISNSLQNKHNLILFLFFFLLTNPFRSHYSRTGLLYIFNGSIIEKPWSCLKQRHFNIPSFNNWPYNCTFCSTSLDVITETLRSHLLRAALCFLLDKLVMLLQRGQEGDVARLYCLQLSVFIAFHSLMCQSQVGEMRLNVWPVWCASSSSLSPRADQ